MATEYPVTAADGSQTRIDILLTHRSASGVYMCMECKRPNPKYKTWIFFDTDTNVAGMNDSTVFIETIFVSTRPAKPGDMKHNLARLPKHHMPLFSYYIEGAINREHQGDPTQKNQSKSVTAKQPRLQSMSSTETIEKAFQQVVRGHSGLMKL